MQMWQKDAAERIIFESFDSLSMMYDGVTTECQKNHFFFTANNGKTLIIQTNLITILPFNTTKKSNNTKQITILPLYLQTKKRNIIIILGQKILRLFLNKNASQEIIVTH